jgi:hypothetical protein
MNHHKFDVCKLFEGSLVHGHQHVVVPVPFDPKALTYRLMGDNGGCGQGMSGNPMSAWCEGWERSIHLNVHVADDTARLTCFIGG